MQEVHLELLVGKAVLDVKGKRVVLIEEVLAEEEHGEWVVKEYLVGASALLERLSAWTVGRGILGLISKKEYPGYRVPWDKLDLSNPARPRLTCGVEELEAFAPR
ncbi:MAG TPA: hypothetical protein VND68_06445, partial [Chloroflexia bacterium]|jgi:sporulation protein YlmC with PRC-barrel domain|nr:hypothetical protein [Chloroflexia bacterium]